MAARGRKMADQAITQKEGAARAWGSATAKAPIATAVHGPACEPPLAAVTFPVAGGDYQSLTSDPGLCESGAIQRPLETSVYQKIEVAARVGATVVMSPVVAKTESVVTVRVVARVSWTRARVRVRRRARHVKVDMRARVDGALQDRATPVKEGSGVRAKGPPANPLTVGEGATRQVEIANTT